MTMAGGGGGVGGGGGKADSADRDLSRRGKNNLLGGVAFVVVVVVVIVIVVSGDDDDDDSDEEEAVRLCGSAGRGGKGFFSSSSRDWSPLRVLSFSAMVAFKIVLVSFLVSIFDIGGGRRMGLI